MKLTVVQCDCGNPEPHRKLEAEDGRRTSGFFSIADGKRALSTLHARGDIEQTDEERAATKQELESCGLPADNPGSPSNPPRSEESLQSLAGYLKEDFPPTEYQALVDMGVVVGEFTPAEGERILALAASTG